MYNVMMDDARTHLITSPSCLTLSASLVTAYTMVLPLPIPTTLVSALMWLSTAARPARFLAAWRV